MATRRGGTSLIELLDALLRRYVECEDRDKEERLRRAVKIAPQRDSRDREQIEIPLRVASGSRGPAARGG